MKSVNQLRGTYQILLFLLLALGSLGCQPPSQMLPPTPTSSPTVTPTWTPHLTCIATIEAHSAATTATTEAEIRSATAIAEPEKIAMATAATPTPKAGATYVNPVDGATYIYVPAGEFIMGSNDDRDNESPEHRVYLDGYWIMRTEVTNEQYNLFMDAGGYRKQAYWNTKGWVLRTETDVTSPRYQDDISAKSVSICKRSGIRCSIVL